MNEISEGTCKIAEYKDSVFYKSHCNCMSDEHIQTLIVSYEEDYGVGLDICSEAFTNSFIWDYDAPWYGKIYDHIKEKLRRVKWAFQILLKGYIQVDNCFMFRNEQAVVSYIAALNQGLEKIRASKKYKESHKNAS